MLVIRLRRIGKRQHATFRFTVSEKTRSPQSTAVEFLGSYDPHTNPPTVNLKRDRVEHWLKVGAKPSATVHNILVDAGLLTGPKVKVAFPKKQAEAENKPGEAAANVEKVESPPVEAVQQASGSAGEEPKKEQAAPTDARAPAETK
ncbi:MAG: 30S ribosomal protein S16 [Candidatus Kerfeldbacteria bacterium]